MCDSNDFDDDAAASHVDGFAFEAPFDDVTAAEVVDDDPWFADVDAAADGLLFDGSDHNAAKILARLLASAPDAYVVARLASIDIASLSPEDAVTFLQIAQRTEAWHAALQMRGYVAAGSGHAQVQELLVLDRRPDHEGERLLRIEDAARDELAAALRRSSQSTHDTLTTARLLVGPLADTLAALESGVITSGHARVIVEAARRLPGCQASIGPAAASDRMCDVEERAGFTRLSGMLQARVVPVAARSTMSRTRAAARRVILAIDAAGEARRRAEARKVRDAFVVNEDDGLALLGVRMATEQAHACLAMIDALAHDDRFASECGATIGERRADAVAALILATQGGDIPQPSLRAHLDITIDLATLLDLQGALTGDDAASHPADAATGEAPVGGAELAGGGPISPDVVRGLLGDPDVAITMRRLVTEPMTGHLLDLGRTRYEVPERLRDFITVRDRTCRFPGCMRKAGRCQVDHAQAWDDGGETSPSNLGALCVRHHQLKTHGGWTITTTHADGSCAWTSPQHREHERPRESVGIPGAPRYGNPASLATPTLDRLLAARPPDLQPGDPAPF